TITAIDEPPGRHPQVSSPIRSPRTDGVLATILPYADPRLGRRDPLSWCEEVPREASAVSTVRRYPAADSLQVQRPVICESILDCTREQLAPDLSGRGLLQL